MHGDLLNQTERPGIPGRLVLQNSQMLKVSLSGAESPFYARQGSMVAYQGEVEFDYEGIPGSSG